MKDFYGHKGYSSNFPCTLCRAPKEELDKLGVARDFGPEETNYSFTAKPLLPVTHFFVIPPSMHILHGLVNKCLTILWENAEKETAIRIIGSKPDPHTQQFIGFF